MSTGDRRQYRRRAIPAALVMVMVMAMNMNLVKEPAPIERARRIPAWTEWAALLEQTCASLAGMPTGAMTGLSVTLRWSGTAVEARRIAALSGRLAGAHGFHVRVEPHDCTMTVRFGRCADDGRWS